MDLSLPGILFSIALALIATAYAAVGQAGATGYIAAMGLAGFSPDVIRPVALALNTLVAAIGTVRFARAGYITWQETYLFILLGLPFSVLGGAAHLSASIYRPVVGILLIAAAWQMVRSARSAVAIDAHEATRPPSAASIIAGAVIGFVAGVTGIGGGIFIAPLVLTLNWLNTRHAAGLSSLFNLLNSAAALAGLWTRSLIFPPELPPWFAAVAVGGIVGSWLGVKHLPPKMLRYILSALLLAGGLEMLVGA
jgi:uncharacterized membrane protein YfcA